jgi:glycosyltransferase involved in cell wall biosynthesis
LKLLLAISSFAGGPANVLSKIVRYAPLCTHSHAIAMMSGSEQIIKNILYKYASSVRILNKRCGPDLSAFVRFLKFTHKLSPDLAISFDFSSNIYCFGTLSWRRVPWIACVRGLESAFVPWRKWVEKIAFAFAKKVVVPSPAVKDKLIYYKIVPSHKIEVIPNGTSLQTNLREIGLRSGQKTIGCVANFYSEVKGHRYAIDSLKDLPQDFRLIMVGDGILKGDMVSHAENIGVKDRVTFLGHKSHDKILDEMRKMDVLVIPSLSESFGLVAIEAMSVRLPVVASRVGGLKIVVDDGVTGKLVPSCNPKMLAHAIEEVLSDQDKYVAMQHACLKRVKKHYSVEAMTNEYFELFDKVLP